MAFPQPTYDEFVYNVSRYFVDECKRLESPQAVLRLWLETFRSGFSAIDFLAVAFLAVLWTALRTYATLRFRRFAKFCGLAKKEEVKAPECLWKVSISLVFWIFSTSLVLGKYDLLFDPSKCVSGYHPDSIVPWDVYFIYATQMSFYVHSIFASLKLDEWRSDTPVLLVHHVVTILLLAISYICKYYLLGLLVLFCHDLSDVFLEGTKLVVYFKTKGGVWTSICDFLSIIGFILLAVSWFTLRLYWYPLKAIYAATYIASQLLDEMPPFSLFLNLLMIILLVMHVYWFTLILRIVYDVTTGKTREISDIREYEDNDNTNQVTSHNLSNGKQGEISTQGKKMR